jgi:hypothetical protein
LSHYRVEALPIPDWPETDPTHREIVRAVASIITKDTRFRNELQQGGYDVRTTEDLQKTKDYIDALVARAYGVTRSELEAVVSTFEKLESVSRSSILDTFDRLGEAI